jgi:L,D-transpeptidase ErfK/SrfK
VDVWVPGEERLVTLPTAHVLPDAPPKGIVINIAELRMFWFRPDGAVETHPIGVGRDGLETPTGQTRIVRTQERPVWYPTAGKRLDNPDLPAAVPPGPDNPLGEYALYLGWPTYLIHGTNKPYGVGRRLSRGCIRMYPEDIESLFPRIPVGTPVTVVDQPIKLGWHEGELYVEAHPDLEQLTQLEDQQAFTLKPAPDLTAEVLRKAGAEAGRVNWRVLEAELVARRALPVQITGVADSAVVAVAPGAVAQGEPASRAGQGRAGDVAAPSGGSLDGIY